MHPQNPTLRGSAPFCCLILGLAVGFLLGLWVSGANIAIAQQKPEVEEITPIMTVGSAAIGTVLAGRIATDQIMVQGVDLIKLHENTLSLLREKGLISSPELNALVERSRPDKILRMKAPEQKKEEK